MPRFTRNRWWAFVLAFAVLLSGSLIAAGPSHSGDGSDPILIIGDGGAPPSGDPDGTAGPNKRYPTSKRQPMRWPGYSAVTVGDGDTPVRAWMWRIHLALWVAKSRFFRI